MLDTNPIAILLAVLAATILPAYLSRAINRLALAERMRRSLRMAVGRELDCEPGRRFQRGRGSRPRTGVGTGSGGEDLAA